MLPPNWCISLDPGTRLVDNGHVLIGGAPLRLLRLTATGARHVERLAGGAPIGTQTSAQRLAQRLLDTGIANPRPSQTSRTQLDVTVVIPIHGRAEELQDTLDRLGPVGGLIVVDDASPDATVAGLARKYGAHVERHGSNRGPAAARNTGWRFSSTELVAFVDAGCVPEDNWLQTLLPHFDDPKVAAVAPRIMTTLAPSLPPGLSAYEAARPSLDRGPTEANVRPRSRVPFVPTATLVVRRSALEATGGFDEAMRIGEDVDLVWRLVRGGSTVRYEPSSKVAHPSRPTTRAWLRQRYDYGTSAAPLARRHGVAVAPLAVSPWTAAAWGLVGGGAPLSGITLAAGSTALLAPRLRSLKHPWREAARLAGLGHLYGGRAVADALRRPWWPFALAGALVSRRARVAVALAVSAPPMIEWLTDRPPLNPIRWIGIRLIDDVAYGAGVWSGCIHERSLAALRPDLSSWPGPRSAVEPAS